MIKPVAILAALSAWLLAPQPASAEEATAQEAGKELGAILAWRLGPEAVEEHCRTADPEGAQVRKEALNTWLAKNDPLIEAVDSRVADIVPQIQRASAGNDPVLAVRAQVRQIFLESVFAGKSPGEATALCRNEANPAHPRWNHNGLPHVRQSLAALDDWEIRRNSLLPAGVASAAEPVVGLPCEGCEAVFTAIPAKLESKARIAPRGEAGEPLELTGRVVSAEGQPRAGVIVYAYHTDAAGIYPRPGKSLGGFADRHGRLRGWAVTDRDGRYTFETIRPASYPNQRIPQHIHMHVIEPGCATYYIDEVVFTDDPMLTPAALEHHHADRGGSGITTPKRAAPGGTWLVTRDIQLGLNIPGYPGCRGKSL